jgi:hypothetical protein
MKLAPASNDNLIEQTRRLWRSRLGRDVSREDARQIVENVTGFFGVLAEWSHAERCPANEKRAWLERLPAIEVRPIETRNLPADEARDDR